MILILLFFVLLLALAVRWGGGEDWEWKKANKKIDKKIDFEPLYSRKIDPDQHQQEQFFGRHYREMLALKSGQRKLLFSELEFYTAKIPHGEPAVVVYAGAASGIHSTFFGEYFPNVQFHFYDMNKFSEDLKDYSNIHLYAQYFTLADAAKWAPIQESNRFLFLSDIRTAEDEAAVDSDMEMQKAWCEIIFKNYRSGNAAMLKFRLRWEPPGVQKYFDGEIYTQPRIGPSSTETRLWTDCQRFRDWDTDAYNNSIFFFQRHQRIAFHEIQNASAFSEIKGLDHCNDCWSELKICKDFLNYSGEDSDDGSRRQHAELQSYNDEAVCELMKKISQHSKSTLDVPPHNLLCNERDINKRITLLEKITDIYVNGLNTKAHENKQLDKKNTAGF